MTVRRAPAILNWAGSKALVAKFLSELDLPQVPTYHEPFLGSGAAYLALASAGVISKSALSDINPRLINVFRSVQKTPENVIAGLRLHSLFDSDVHFSAVLGRLNAQTSHDIVDGQSAADTIYLLSQSLHSTWYETLAGMVSMSRRRDAAPFQARLQDVVRAAALLQHVTVTRADFRSALAVVEPSDLVFLDPPYLYGEEQSDQQAYNADRFIAADLRDLAADVRRVVGIGAHVVFCWGERLDYDFPPGQWTTVRRDHVWISESLSFAVPYLRNRSSILVA